MTDIDAIVARLDAQLDNATATIVASDDPEKRHFIGEAILTAVAIYLLNKYADGYLEGLGFIAMAREHGEKTRAWFFKLRKGSVSGEEIKEQKEEMKPILAELMQQPNNIQATANAERGIVDLVTSLGAPELEGRKAAKTITDATFGKGGK